jgi:hypothetical protein
MNPVSALKNRLVIALIIAGAITIAVPILVCSLVSFLWEFCLSFAASKVFLVVERFDSGPKSQLKGQEHATW